MFINWQQHIWESKRSRSHFKNILVGEQNEFWLRKKRYRNKIEGKNKILIEVLFHPGKYQLNISLRNLKCEHQMWSVNGLKKPASLSKLKLIANSKIYDQTPAPITRLSLRPENHRFFYHKHHEQYSFQGKLGDIKRAHARRLHLNITKK